MSFSISGPPTADGVRQREQRPLLRDARRRRRRRRASWRRSRRRRRSRRAGGCSAPRSGGVVDRQRLGVALLLVELRGDETPLERGDDDRVRREQGAADDPEQRQRELDADAAGDAHPSRKRYPAPRTVRISSGSRGSSLDLLAQMPDVHVDRSRLPVVGAAAQALEQLAPRVDDTRVRREQGEKLELHERQLYRCASHLDGAPGQVDRGRRRGRSSRPACHRGAASLRGAGRRARGSGTRGSGTAS